VYSTRMGRDAFRVLVETPEGKGPLGKPRLRWEDNITIHIQEIGLRDRGRIDLAHDRDRLQAMSTLMNILVTSNAGNFLTSWGTFGLLRWTQLRTVIPLVSQLVG